MKSHAASPALRHSRLAADHLNGASESAGLADATATLAAAAAQKSPAAKSGSSFILGSSKAILREHLAPALFSAFCVGLVIGHRLFRR